MKAFSISLEQIAAIFVIILTILMSISQFAVYNKALYINEKSSLERIYTYYQLQQLAYGLALGYNTLNTGNSSIQVFNESSYGLLRGQCNFSYYFAKNYSCGIVAHLGRLYIIRVSRNA